MRLRSGRSLDRSFIAAAHPARPSNERIDFRRGGLFEQILTTPALRSEVAQGPQAQSTFPTLARFLAKVYDDHVAPHEARRALFEPRRTAAPDGYHSTKCVAAGLYALSTQSRLAAEDGEVLPTEVTGSTFCYRVLEHGVPIYFVDEEFTRAVAATQLPDDFTFGDLHWPQAGMVVGWPPRFMRKYTGREFCHVYAANCPAGSYWVRGLEGMPVIEVPEGRLAIHSLKKPSRRAKTRHPRPGDGRCWRSYRVRVDGEARCLSLLASRKPTWKHIEVAWWKYMATTGKCKKVETGRAL